MMDSYTKPHSNYISLSDFLKNKRSAKNEKFTHTGMSQGFRGRYCIEDKDLEEFYELYYHFVFIDKNKIGLTEANREYTPIKIDLDFKYELIEDKIIRKYSLDDIKKIISFYMEVIEEYYEFTSEKERLCFIMEKNKPSLKGNIVKDGVHLMFPYLVTDFKSQYFFRSYVLSKVGEVLDKFKLTNDNHDVIDLSVIERNNWMLYGSCKENNEPYLVTKIYKTSSKIEEFIEQPLDTYTDKELMNILSIRTHFNQPSLLKQEKEAEFIEKYEPIRKKMTTRSGKSVKKHGKIKKISKEELSTIKLLVDNLSIKRADSRDSWIEVGWALHNMGSNKELLDYWIDFSKKAEHYSLEAEESCTKEWDCMEYRNMGLLSLIHWSKTDNPDGHKVIGKILSAKSLEKCIKVEKLGNKTIEDLFEKELSISPDAIAEVLHDMFQYEFIMVSNRGKGTYYQFEGHKWEEMAGHILLREKIRTDVKQNLFEYIGSIFTNSASDVGNEISSDTQNEMKDKILSQQKKILKVFVKLGETTFKNNVMEECKEFFFDREGTFLKNLNENPSLLCFNNGVYNLDKDTFENGKPEDYISMTTKIDYQEYNWDDEMIGTIMEFIEQILPKKSVRDYVLTLLGSFLHGANRSEKFHIWTGTGSNGKSKIIELFEMAIGEYACKLPISLLTSKRKGSNEAQPELARIKGKRSAVLQEPDEKTRINVGLMKEMTGGDTIIARNLYESPIEFKPQAKMILICNHLPELPYDDEATWRRVRSVEFTSKFVDKDVWDRSDPSQHPKDPTLSDNFPLWKEGFMWILIQYHKIFRENGLYEPEEVLECTRKYQAKNDHFAEFIENNLIKNESCEEPLHINDIYQVYKGAASINGEKPKQRKELVAYLEKSQLGPLHGESATKKYLKGWTLVDDNDEDDEGDNLSSESDTFN